MQHPNPRHIQNFSAASSLQPHWGYADRVVPCTNDAKSCNYLDVVYHSHDLGMLYCGIIWATILAILLIWCIHTFIAHHPSGQHQLVHQGDSTEPQIGTWQRIRAAVTAYWNRLLLPEFAQPIFGPTTRLQVLVLVVLTGYLTVFSFVGIVYRTWITPVKKIPGLHNTRTSLGPWSDRVGVLAFALTPLSILLSSRESLLSIITGLPYQSFNFLHRWLGYIIVIQSVLHTIGWCVIEMRLYQPQPTVGREWIAQTYMIWGVIAMSVLFSLFVLSTPWAIKRTGYEFFRKSHYVLAMLYIGACWGHWSALECYLIPALVVWFIDRGLRLLRTAQLHYHHVDGASKMQFRCANAEFRHFHDPLNGDVVRLDFRNSQDPWAVGQHFYLTFPKSSIWQSHPFTPLNAPVLKDGELHHSYVFRAKAGETAKIARMAETASAPSADENEPTWTTSVILSGPYGVSEVDHLSPTTNILCIVGGTGISYVLPVLLSQTSISSDPSNRKLQLVWAVRHQDDVRWVQAELKRLHRLSQAINLRIDIFVTRAGVRTDAEPKSVVDGKLGVDTETSSVSSSTSIEPSTDVTAANAEILMEKADKKVNISSIDAAYPAPCVNEDGPKTRQPKFHRPNLHDLVSEFIATTVHGSTTIYASGPGSMVSDIREVVASANNGRKVWKGDMRYCVELKCDDRLEW